jgi:NAD(P)-dependent dehydrogenase (short-subunit alcohol dehydrogenase family)
VDLQLKGKTAIVTGGSRGIGLAVATALAAEGVDVALVARDPGRLTAAAGGLARHGTRVFPVTADTTDDAAVRSMVDGVVAEFGGVDILVNAAAKAAGGPEAAASQTTDEALREQVDTKVLGYLRCARAVAPLMVESGWGRIVNIAGLAARNTGNVVGTIRNVAVVAMTKNLADELGPRGVNVTVVHPGMTRTERTPEAMAAMAQSRGTTVEELERALEGGVSIGRLVTAEEVASVVAFLASPKSVALNGDAVIAGGGARGSIHY